MSGEAKINTILERKGIWYPTAEVCYSVAVILTQVFPRNQGLVPSILRIIREMLRRKPWPTDFLFLDNNQITDAGLVKLAEMLPSSKLTKLWLSGNQITDAGFIKLAEMLPSSELIELSLGNSQITDYGNP